MNATEALPVIIVGAGLAGLACARRLTQNDVPFLIVEADREIGGRIKTTEVDGFILNHGFQVLQTAYPEARQVLDFAGLDLKPFAPGAIIRIGGKFHRIADPLRRPRDLLATLTAPIGSMADRIRILNLVRKVRRQTVSDLFNSREMSTADFLRAEGFSDRIIARFFQPFFAGVCLDPEMRASSRVFQYVFRIFAERDVALPARGMAAIVNQLAGKLPPGQIQTEARVESIRPDSVKLATGRDIAASAVVLATEAPETARLSGLPWQGESRGEYCLYYAAGEAPLEAPYLILNANGLGRINSLTVPSVVAPGYAPPGQHLISVVVIENPRSDDVHLKADVREELTEWFGAKVNEWRHLVTFRIKHALPTQLPPTPDPTKLADAAGSGIYICGEFNSVPGIQWALLSGRLAAEQVIKDLGRANNPFVRFIHPFCERMAE